jgi:CRISPR-associated protein Cmr1
MFLNGADTKQPELRAASVRGQLRYWLRAYVGAETSNLSEVWECESAVFGSTGQGSAVSVRLFGKSAIDVDSYDMLPHKANQRDRSPQKAISPDMSASLQLVTRPGVPMPPEAITALKLWSLLGGLGKRSRRMFGAVQVTGFEDLTLPHSADELSEQLKKVLSDSVHSKAGLYKGNEYPEFPTLHEDQCAVWFGKDGFGSHVKAEEKLFSLLHKDYVNQRMFGFAGYSQDDQAQLKLLHGRKRREFEEKLIKRRASPLIAQLRCVDNELYPVFTFFRSKPIEISSEHKIDWNIHNRLMDDIKNEFNAVLVWGDRFK